jgi:cbb3-type cytochrome oxidase maturation protein
MLTYYILVFGILALFGVMVVWALWWAIRGGQFSDFQKGATSIFDDDEPLGKLTDAFPDRKHSVEGPFRGNE